MSTIETWFWIAFVIVCVISVHPAIDLVIDQSWKLNDRIVWERSRRSKVWGRIQRLFIETVNAFEFSQSRADEFNVVRRNVWAKHFRGEIGFVEAIAAVKAWTEKTK